MGLFVCSHCGGYKDSDDGCSEDPFDDMKLICPDCEEEIGDDHIEEEDLPAYYRRDYPEMGLANV